MRSTSAVVALVALIVACATHRGAAAPPQPAIDLLANGNCAGGTLAPWLPVSGVAWRCCNTQADCGEALNGTHLFYPGPCSGPDCPGRNNPLLQELLQEVDLASMATEIDAGTVSLALSGNLKSHCGLDAAILGLSLTDASGNVMSTVTSCRYQDTSWGPVTLRLPAPASTRFARVHLIAEARRGTSADGYFDGLRLRGCTTGVDCPEEVALVCPTMATDVAAGSMFRSVVRECGGAIDLSELAGFEVMVARRTGYCTKDCAAVWDAYWRALSSAKAPDCTEYRLVSTTLEREAGYVNRLCDNPVDNTYTPQPTGDNAASSVATSAVVTACAATVAAALSVLARRV